MLTKFGCYILIVFCNKSVKENEGAKTASLLQADFTEGICFLDYVIFSFLRFLCLFSPVKHIFGIMGFQRI